jgi:hypothetical protein
LVGGFPEWRRREHDPGVGARRLPRSSHPLSARPAQGMPPGWRIVPTRLAGIPGLILGDPAVGGRHRPPRHRPHRRLHPRPPGPKIEGADLLLHPRRWRRRTSSTSTTQPSAAVQSPALRHVGMSSVAPAPMSTPMNVRKRSMWSTPARRCRLSPAAPTYRSWYHTFGRPSLFDELPERVGVMNAFVCASGGIATTDAPPPRRTTARTTSTAPGLRGIPLERGLTGLTSA